MSVTLTIKNVPDELAAALRAQAARNHRSLQGELMSVLEAVVAQTQPPASRASLLRELDAIVAGSRFGAEPLLTREQIHDRPLRLNVAPPQKP